MKSVLHSIWVVLSEMKIKVCECPDSMRIWDVSGTSGEKNEHSLLGSFVSQG